MRCAPLVERLPLASPGLAQITPLAVQRPARTGTNTTDSTGATRSDPSESFQPVVSHALAPVAAARGPRTHP